MASHFPLFSRAFDKKRARRYKRQALPKRLE